MPNAKAPVFALVDCNNFFVSCERVFRPDLAEKPVAVLSNNDGCIVARSQEVKRLGVPMGAPRFKYQSLLAQHRVKLFSANFALYGDFSRRVVEVLKSFTPHIEVYSIDESFLEVGSLLVSDYQLWAEGVSQTVHQLTGIPVSVGVGPSKTLAKAATELAKRGEGTRGAIDLFGASRTKIEQLLARLPIEEVWGIGRRSAAKLGQLGLRTAADLAAISPRVAKQRLTISGERTVRELKGEACFKLGHNLSDSAQQSLAVTRSFGRAMRSGHQLESAVASFATKAAARLRQKHQIAGAATVFIRTGVGSAEPYSVSTLVKLEYPTADTAQLVAAAVAGLGRIYRSEHAIKRAGVVLLDLRPDSAQQMTLSHQGRQSQLDKSDRLMAAFDELNAKYGTRVLRTAREGPPETAAWASRRHNVSPQYTTKWTDLAVIS